MIRIGASKEEMKNYIQGKRSNIQDKISADICAIRSGQAEFEQKITYKLETQLKAAGTVVKQQTQILRQEFSSEIQEARLDVQATHRDLQATRREIQSKLAAV
jgi:hypothetical protein